MSVSLSIGGHLLAIAFGDRPAVPRARHDAALTPSLSVKDGHFRA
jgi:hypothetical protein